MTTRQPGTLQYALVNMSTRDVLRTSDNLPVLESVRDSMNAGCAKLNGEPMYRVQLINRDVMGNEVFKRAIDVRWQQMQRNRQFTSTRPRERELTANRLMGQLARFTS